MSCLGLAQTMHVKQVLLTRAVFVCCAVCKPGYGGVNCATSCGGGGFSTTSPAVSTNFTGTALHILQQPLCSAVHGL